MDFFLNCVFSIMIIFSVLCVHVCVTLLGVCHAFTHTHSFAVTRLNCNAVEGEALRSTVNIPLL